MAAASHETCREDLSVSQEHPSPSSAAPWLGLALLVSEFLDFGVASRPSYLPQPWGWGYVAQARSWLPEPTACTLFPMGPDLTSRKFIPVGSSPRPHLPGDSFLEAVTATGTVEAATVELIRYG